MIRMYDDLAGKILTALTTLRTRHGKQRIRDMAIDTLDAGPRRWGIDDGVDGSAINEVDYWMRLQRDGTLDEVINELSAILLARRAGVPKGEKTLIDTIVETLKLDNGASILSGKTFRMLRSALLLPTEMLALNKRIRSRTMTCGGCGRELGGGEAATVVVAGDEAVMLINCHACTRPRVIKCEYPNCNETAVITSKSRFQQGCLCSKHQKGSDTAEAPEIGVQIIAPGGRPVDPFFNLRRAQVRRPAARPRDPNEG